MFVWDVAGGASPATHPSRGDAPATRTDRRSPSRRSSRRRIRRIASISSAPCRKAVATGDEFDVEYRVPVPDGSVRWIAARGRAEKGKRHQMLGVAVDITERKLAELRAVEDRNALRHMTRVSMLGQLSASIAHQLNQPLAAILGNAEAARKMLGQGTGRSRRAARDLRRYRGRRQPGGGGHPPPGRAVQARRHEDGAVRPQRADSRDARTAAGRIADPPCHAAHRSGAGAADHRWRTRAIAAGGAQSRPECCRCHERCRRREAQSRAPHRSDGSGRSPVRRRQWARDSRRRPEESVRSVLQHEGRRHGHRARDLPVDRRGASRQHHGDQQPGRRNDVLREPAAWRLRHDRSVRRADHLSRRRRPERAEGALARVAGGRLERRDVRVRGGVPRPAGSEGGKGASCST